MFERALRIAREMQPTEPRTKTIHVETPNVTIRAREVMQLSAILEAIKFIEEMRDIMVGSFNDFDARRFDAILANLQFAIPEAPKPRSGVLADLITGREA